MTMVRACRGWLGHMKSFLADRRGVSSFEILFVYPLLLFSLFLPLADVAIAGFHYISAWGALRAFGQSIQYNPPPDVTNASGVASWAASAEAKADSRYPISALSVLCGASSTVCSSTNKVPPMSYSYSTTITLAPLVLKSVLCTGGTGNSCTFTLSYSERFQ